MVQRNVQPGAAHPEIIQRHLMARPKVGFPGVTTAPKIGFGSLSDVAWVGEGVWSEQG
jgi:hypothetical protein